MNAPHLSAKTVGLPQRGLIVLILAGLVLLGGCASQRPHPVPGLPPAYKVMGSWYQPIYDSSGFKQRGLASWYGPQFHGKKTANGEIYDMHALTAAHKTLPLGTRVKVLNLSNGKEVVVRINDRGPFVKGRIIDLSFTAAKALGLVKRGTGRVEITALSNRIPPVKEKELVGIPAAYTLQVGSFSEKSNAESLANVLANNHQNVSLVSEQGRFKVRVGRFSAKEDTERLKRQLADQGYPAFAVSLSPDS